MTAATIEEQHKQADRNEKRICSHCGLDVPPTMAEEGAEQQFCCGGCRVAYETIHGCGLEDYYGVRDRFANLRRASQGQGDDYSAYDSLVFQEEHTREAADGLRAIDLSLEGVHCAACVWLVERLPKILPGVVEARLSLADSNARITWDPECVSLGRIATQLDRLGYAPHPLKDRAARTARGRRERSRLIGMAVAGALAGNNMLIALALYAGVFDGIEHGYATLFRWFSMLIGWVSLLWPGRVFFSSAVSAIRARSVNLDLPISIALGAGAAAGTANVLLDRGDIYFDSLSVLVFLLLVGRFVQARQQRWAEDSIGKMLSLTPDSCRVVQDGSTRSLPPEALRVGDLVEVRAGELFPADGVVQRGRSTIDRSVLTGETTPQEVVIGDRVSAGVQNNEATLRVRVTAVGDKTRMGRLMRLVEESLREKPAIVAFADRVAGWFVAVVALLAAINFTAWCCLHGLGAAIDTTVALLVVACPCALGLATPLTIAIAIGVASRRGMLIKSSRVIEVLGRPIDKKGPGRMLLDKTGTLTAGRPEVLDWDGDESVLPYLLSMENESNHPIAGAIVARCMRSGAKPGTIWDRRERHGHGIEANSPLGSIRVGAPEWVLDKESITAEGSHRQITTAGHDGQTLVAAGVDGQYRGRFLLQDIEHDDAAEALAELASEGWNTEILSGDSPGPVQAVASNLGVPAELAMSGLTPEAKLAAVRTAVSERDHAEQAVVMVGDGVNDAAAMAAADIGIAVSGGAEVALAASDVYIAAPGVSPLVDLARLSRKTMRVVWQNLAISLAYNALAVSMAAAGAITPLVAAVLMPISSTTVLALAVCRLGAAADSIGANSVEAQ